MALPLTPIRFLERAVNVYGSKIGVVCGDKEFTYAQFGRRCAQLATALTSLGVRPGDRVAYLSFNTHKLLEGYYGVILAGAVVMPLNVRLALPELIEILNHAGPTVLLFEADFTPMIAHFREHCPSIRVFVSLDAVAGTQPEDELQYEPLLAAHEPAVIDIYRGRDEETAELFYTSGSTGSPKGVMLSHRALYQHAFSVATLSIDPPTAVDLLTIPLFHANGWGAPQANLLLGIKQVMVRRFDPLGVLQTIQKVRATDMSVVPTMGNALLNVPGADNFDLSSMRQIHIGGAAASPSLIERMERLFQCEVFTGYGLTESCPVLTMAREKGTTVYASDSDRWEHRAATGWSIPGVHLRVVDYKMQDVPRDGESIGEIIASCDWLMTGYYKDPAGTAAALTGPDGEPGGVQGRPVWLHTGDMATWDDEEFLVIVDRRKEIIISGGENISSLEIEKHICAHPAVFECAVVAAPEPQWGEIPVAVIVIKPDERLTKEELLAFLGERLSRFKLPRLVEFVPGPLPKTGTGKIKKMEIREPYWKAHEKRIQG